MPNDGLQVRRAISFQAAFRFFAAFFFSYSACRLSILPAWLVKYIITSASVEDFINTVKDEQKRKDSFVILEMMKKASGEEPKMWGSSIIGFGNVR